LISHGYLSNKKNQDYIVYEPVKMWYYYGRCRPGKNYGFSGTYIRRNIKLSVFFTCRQSINLVLWIF